MYEDQQPTQCSKVWCSLKQLVFFVYCALEAYSPDDLYLDSQYIHNNKNAQNFYELWLEILLILERREGYKRLPNLFMVVGHKWGQSQVK